MVVNRPSEADSEQKGVFLIELTMGNRGPWGGSCPGLEATRWFWLVCCKKKKQKKNTLLGGGRERRRIDTRQGPDWGGRKAQGGRKGSSRGGKTVQERRT